MLVVELMRQDKVEVRGRSFVEVIGHLTKATFNKEDIKIQGMDVARDSKEISTTRASTTMVISTTRPTTTIRVISTNSMNSKVEVDRVAMVSFTQALEVMIFFGRGNGNNGYRNHRRYEFRGTRPSGGANGGPGYD
jgi:uncharacterized DUF497 family protein